MRTLPAQEPIVRWLRRRASRSCWTLARARLSEWSRKVAFRSPCASVGWPAGPKRTWRARWPR